MVLQHSVVSTGEACLARQCLLQSTRSLLLMCRVYHRPRLQTLGPAEGAESPTAMPRMLPRYVGADPWQRA